MWIFLHGMDAKKWRTHLFEWGIPCQLNDPEICHRVRGGSRTWCVISQLPNGHNLKTHADRNGTPSTKNTGTLQQCYGLFGGGREERREDEIMCEGASRVG